MKRRRIWLAPAIACVVGSALAGCEAMERRKGGSKVETPLVMPGEPLAGQGQDASPEEAAARRQFKSNRLPGALSDQGAEIERSFGIGR
jgi:hypothetical protein